MDFLLELGLKAFRKGDWDQAIAAWSGFARGGTGQERAALAEAHFRRGLAQLGGPDRAGAPDPSADLLQALELVPNDGRFWFHLGLCRQRKRDWVGAEQAYGRAEQAGFSRLEALAFVRGLLALERDPEADPERGRVFLRPFEALLRRDWLALTQLPAWPVVAQSKGTPAWPSLVSLFQGIGHAGLGHYSQAIELLGGFRSDHFPVPVEALRVQFLAQALEGVGRAAEAAKLRAAAFARTRSPGLGAALARTALGDLEAAAEASRWPEVEALALAILKQAPGHPRALRAGATALDQLGRQAAGRGDWKAAGSHWEALLRLLGGERCPERLVPVRHNLALALERQERWTAAADAWQACAAALPKRLNKALTQPGGAFPGLDREGLARRRAWLERRALEMRRRSGCSAEILRQEKALLKHHSEDLGLRLEYVRRLLQAGQWRSAWKEAQAVLRTFPGDPEALELQAECLLRDGAFAAAEVSLRHVLQLHPQRASARHGLATVLKLRCEDLRWRGDLRRARGLLEEACALAAHDFQARLALADLCRQLGDAQGARTQVQAALAVGGGAAYLGAFEACALRGDSPAAQELVEAARAAGKADRHFCLEAAASCLDAADQAPLAAVKQHDNRAAWQGLARVLFDQALVVSEPLATLKQIVAMTMVGEPSLAVAYAERLALLAPRDPEVLLNLALAQSGAKRAEDVLRTLERAEQAARASKDGQRGALIRGARVLVRERGSAELHRSFVRYQQELELGSGPTYSPSEELPF